MSYSTWQAVANTPWWVFVIFLYLLRIGMLATKGRIISIRSLFILPVIYIPLSVISIYATMQITILSTFLWSGALLVGVFLGCLQFRITKIKAVKGENKLYVPGTWNVLIFVILLFIAKYYFGYDEMAFDLELFSQPKFAAGLFALYGFFAGLFIGRAMWARRCLKVGPYLVNT